MANLKIHYVFLLEYWSFVMYSAKTWSNIIYYIFSPLSHFTAVGMQTYIYEVEKNGDPNSDFDPSDPEQVEMQYLVKWKGWAHLHNTWESDESLKTQKVWCGTGWESIQ